MKPQALNLESEIFDDFREKLDRAITVAMRNMVSKGIMTGSVTGKIKIELDTEIMEDGEMIYKPKIEPVIDIKIGAKGKIECGQQAGFLMKPDGGGGFVIGTDQISMDELMDESRGA